MYICIYYVYFGSIYSSAISFHRLVFLFLGALVVITVQGVSTPSIFYFQSYFLLRSPSAHSNGVQTFPYNIYKHTCYCLSCVKQFEQYKQCKQRKQCKQCSVERGATSISDGINVCFGCPNIKEQILPLCLKSHLWKCIFCHSLPTVMQTDDRTRLTYNCAHLRSTKESLTI